MIMLDKEVAHAHVNGHAFFPALRGILKKDWGKNESLTKACNLADMYLFSDM